MFLGRDVRLKHCKILLFAHLQERRSKIGAIEKIDTGVGSQSSWVT